MLKKFWDTRIPYYSVDLPLALAGADALGFSALPSFFAFFSFGFPDLLASFCSTASGVLITGCACSVVDAALASLDAGLFLGNGIALAATKIHQNLNAPDENVSAKNFRQ